MLILQQRTKRFVKQSNRCTLTIMNFALINNIGKKIMDIKDKRITVTVVNHTKYNSELMLSLNWDSDLDEWVSAFKTILMHQTFCEDSIKEVFVDPNQP